MIYKEGIKEMYIGSTFDLNDRKKNHKNSCNNPNDPKYNLKVYQFIRDNGNFDKWTFEMIEKYDCMNKRELEQREQYYLNINKEFLLNDKNAYSSEEDKKEYKKECDKKYRIANKDKLKEYNKNYYEANKEKYLEYNKNYYEANKEKLLEYYKNQYEANKEKINEYNKNYYIANKDKKKEYNKNYKIANKDKKKEYDKQRYQQKKQKNVLIY